MRKRQTTAQKERKALVRDIAAILGLGVVLFAFGAAAILATFRYPL